jgi:hypothetical protein
MTFNNLGPQLPPKPSKVGRKSTSSSGCSASRAAAQAEPGCEGNFDRSLTEAPAPGLSLPKRPKRSAPTGYPIALSAAWQLAAIWRPHLAQRTSCGPDKEGTHNPPSSAVAVQLAPFHQQVSKPSRQLPNVRATAEIPQRSVASFENDRLQPTPGASMAGFRPPANQTSRGAKALLDDHRQKFTSFVEECQTEDASALGMRRRQPSTSPSRWSGAKNTSPGSKAKRRPSPPNATLHCKEEISEFNNEEEAASPPQASAAGNGCLSSNRTRPPPLPTHLTLFQALNQKIKVEESSLLALKERKAGCAANGNPDREADREKLALLISLKQEQILELKLERRELWANLGVGQ